MIHVFVHLYALLVAAAKSQCLHETKGDTYDTYDTNRIYPALAPTVAAWPRKSSEAVGVPRILRPQRGTSS